MRRPPELPGDGPSLPEPGPRMLTVYAIPPSLYCAKLRVLLRHKSLTWEEVSPPGGYGSEAYKALVPGGNLPALRHGELLIADSEAIAEYLEECWPDRPALPADPADRARARARSRFHDTRLEPAVRACFAHLPGRAPATPTRAGELSAIARDYGPDQLRLAGCAGPPPRPRHRLARRRRRLSHPAREAAGGG